MGGHCDPKLLSVRGLATSKQPEASEWDVTMAMQKAVERGCDECPICMNATGVGRGHAKGGGARLRRVPDLHERDR